MSDASSQIEALSWPKLKPLGYFRSEAVINV